VCRDHEWVAVRTVFDGIEWELLKDRPLTRVLRGEETETKREYTASWDDEA
jgi:hypothetical protein